MTVAFKELGGSPTETWDESGMHAERIFRVAWDERWAFVMEALGNGLPFGAIRLGDYPGAPGVLCIGATAEPFMGESDAPDQQAIANHQVGMQSYGYAKVKLSYKFQGDDLENDNPNAVEDPRDEATQATTLLSYRADYGAEYIAMMGTDVVWESTSTIPESHDFEAVIRLSIINHHLTFHRVSNPPFSAIRKANGKLNDLSFMGAGRGLMLFDGATVGREYIVGDGDSLINSYWSLEYLFKEKRIHTGGTDATGTEVVRGWNWAYRSHPEADAGWYMLNLKNGEPLYQYGDFGALFQEEVADGNLQLQGDDQVEMA